MSKSKSKVKVDVKDYKSKAQKITSTKIKKASVDTEPTTTLFPVVECFTALRNLWARPEIEELTITHTAYMKLMAYIHLIGKYEISGFGRVQKIDDEYYVTDFDIIKQTVEGAYVESDEDAILDFLRRTPADQREEWILDWHSHVRMSTNPSGTDWNNYEDMLTARMNHQFPILVVNQNEEMTAYQIITPEKHTEIGLCIEDKPFNEEELRRIYDSCKKQIQELCSYRVRKAPTITTTQWNNTTGGWNWSWKNWAGKTDSQDYIQTKITDKSSNSIITEDDDEIDDMVAYHNEGYQMQCEYCGNILKTRTELEYGCCEKCWEEFVQK